MLYLDKLDFERRMAVEKDIEKQWDTVVKKKGQNTSEEPSMQCVIPSLGFDESDTFLYFGTPVGIKVMNLHTGQFVRVIGKVESTERFL